MKYLVFFENQFCLLGKEYFGEFDGKIIGYHNPSFAKLFDSKESAKKFASLFHLDTKIEEAEPHLEAFKACDYIYRQIVKLDPRLNRKYKEENRDEVLNWWMEYKKAPENSISYDSYKTWPKLYSLFTYLWDVQSYNDRDYKNSYHTVQVRFPKDGVVTDFIKELSKVLDFVTYEKEGYKILPIFDHTLSEFGTAYLYYKSTQDCKIVRGSWTVIPGTITHLFNNHLIKDYYYENPYE